METKASSKMQCLVSEIMQMAEYAKVNAADGLAGSDLERDAKSIEDAGDDNSTLTEFHKYAVHWKGLRDIYFPDRKKQRQWNRKVKHVRHLCEDVMLERGLLKPTLLRRLISLLKH